jgi:hypothetical protein
MAIHSTMPQLVFGIASQFIELVAGPGASVCIRLIHDTDKSAPTILLRGTLSDLWMRIQSEQARGYGVFMVINEGGNKDSEILRVRAVFVDGDDIFLPEKWHVPPDFIVQRDETHWHAYWRVLDLRVDQFKAVQQRLAAHYGTDTAICNPSRVMRIPGFLHQKGQPTRVKLIDQTGGTDPCLLGCSTDEVTAELATLAAVEGGARLSKTAGLPTPAAVARGVTLTKADWPITLPCLLNKLRHIDPGCKRDAWLAVGGALHYSSERGLVTLSDMVTPDAAFDGLEIFTRWSAGEL